MGGKRKSPGVILHVLVHARRQREAEGVAEGMFLSTTAGGKLVLFLFSCRALQTGSVCQVL